MKPYYERNGITIYNSDCLEVMLQLDPQSFALIFVDWPYFKVKNEPWDRQWDKPEKFLSWIDKTLVQAKRLLAPNGSFYGCASPQMSTKIELAIGEHFNVLNNIRWYKEAGWHQKTDKEAIRSYLSPWEAIVFAEQWFSDAEAAEESNYYSQCKALHKNVYAPIGRYIQKERERAGVTRNDIEVALGYVSSGDPTRGTALCYRWEEGSSLPTKEAYLKLRDYLNSLNCRSDYLRREYEDLRREYEDLRREYEDLRRPFNGSKDTPHSDLWTFSPVQDYPGKHPTEKPIALLEHIIKTSTHSGDTVLDFCMGNGTTLKAAQNLGRKAVGIDITEMYCRRTAERLHQMNLFSSDTIEEISEVKEKTFPISNKRDQPEQLALSVEYYQNRNA
jgi:site-specific DNA-methyltransferase (adenine-specific)